MNTDRNNSVNTHGQKKVWSKSNGTRRYASQIEKACERETPSSVCCSPGVTRKSVTSARKGNDGSETFLKNMLENNLSKPETLIVELNDKTEYTLTRDEIVSRRKLKVAARKKLKKLEKIHMNEKVAVELVEKQSFSLQLSSEDFPTLNSHNTKKRINTSREETSITEVEKDSTEKSSLIIDTKCSKTTEKSWKPKVKDPIHIDLSQVLLNKNEKHKLGIKKADPPIQRNPLAGNILDSDNPTRKKGKVRPDKVPKPSKLKSHILIERKKKLSETKENTSGNSECSLYETTVNDDIKPCGALEKADENALFNNPDFTHPVTTDRERKQIETNQNVISSVFPTNIHSRRFREYCTNCLTEEVVTSVCALLEKVAYFQDRIYAREPIKASAKRRYVAGINQVSKYLQVGKVKLLVIAPDLEKNPGEGGLDERVQYFKMEAESQGITCVFGPNRKRLGKAVKKNTLVSCVAVLSYEGAEDQYAQVLEALLEGKTKYLRLIGFHEDDDTKYVQDINLNAEESYACTSDVTSSLLATLREQLPPADRLLNAIQHGGAWAEE